MKKDMDDIFALLEDVTGRGTARGLQSLRPFGPLLVLIADAAGKVIASDDPEGELEASPPGLLAAEIARRLVDEEACRFELAVRGATLLALAVRLPGHPEGGLLGCVLRSSDAARQALDGWPATAVLGAALASAICRHQAENRRLGTRVEHLVAERQMLKTSHAEAISAAIEERETRLSEQESHMRQLQAVMTKNQMILNSVGEGIIGVDGNGKMVFVNPAAAKMLGHKIDELVGKAAHATFHHSRPNGAPYAMQECPTQAALRGEPILTVSNECFWRRDGTGFPVEYTSTPIRDGEAIVGAVVTFQDITQRKALEAQLRQAQKMESIGQLAAGIAHEINTPTQYIGDNARFLEDIFADLSELLTACNDVRRTAGRPAAPEPALARIAAAAEKADVEYLLDEIPKAIAQSLEGVQRVAKIVRSMKDFSHPGGDEKQAIDLNLAVESTLTISRNEWKYVADLVTEFDPQLPLVPCLPGDFNQAVLNLVVNAAHAIGDKVGAGGQKGTIAVSTRRDGDWAEVRIRDTGTGIPEKIRAKVYDPFFTTKAVGRGTGQGLAIAHSIISEKHRGTIDFETVTGEGTTFIIRLPLNDKPAAQEPVKE